MFCMSLLSHVGASVPAPHYHLWVLSEKKACLDLKWNMGGGGQRMFLVGCSILVKARMGKSSTAEMKGRHNTNKE